MSKTINHPRQGQLDVTINGEPRGVRPGTTLADVLRELGLASGKVAIERNRAIAPRSQFETIELQSGDTLEIVRFVGGG